MNCDANKRGGRLISALLFLGFALSFAALCLGGRYLISFIGSYSRSRVASSDGGPVVIVDAGHGGEDGGAKGVNGVLEKDLNLMISKDLACLFSIGGYDVVETRTEDVLLYDKNADHAGKKKVLDLAARLALANDNDCLLFLSIHMNSFPESKYSGAQVYYSRNSPSSRIFAEDIQNRIRENIQQENEREIKSAGKNIFLLDRMTCPSVLVECGFISNPEECEKLCSEEYRRLLSLVIFCSVSERLDKGAE